MATEAARALVGRDEDAQAVDGVREIGERNADVHEGDADGGTGIEEVAERRLYQPSGGAGRNREDDPATGGAEVPHEGSATPVPVRSIV